MVKRTSPVQVLLKRLSVWASEPIRDAPNAAIARIAWSLIDICKWLQGPSELQLQAGLALGPSPRRNLATDVPMAVSDGTTKQEGWIVEQQTHKPPLYVPLENTRERQSNQ